MKKSLIITSALLSATVLVGAGFSAWYFEVDQTASKTITGTVTTHPVSEASSVLTLNNDVSTFVLDLDQGAPHSDAANEGIKITAGSEEELDLGFTFAVTLTNDEQNHVDDFVATYSVAITLDPVLASYVEADGRATDVEITSKAITGSTDKTVTFTVTSLPITFEYVNKPSNKAEVEAMNTAIQGIAGNPVTIELSVTADCPHN